MTLPDRATLPAAPLLGKPAKSVGRSPEEARARRFALQRQAAQILKRERVGRCLWDIADTETAATITATTGPEARARLMGLQTCGSVWACPVCADRIARTRRDEMNAALEHARAEGLAVFLLTLTFSHQAGEALADTLGALKAAKKAFHQHRAFKDLRASLVGSITATEVTKGRHHGWHPHLHCLVFWKGDDGAASLEALRDPWLASLAGKGRTGAGAAFHVQSAERAGDYVAKWGAGEEMIVESMTKEALAAKKAAKWGAGEEMTMNAAKTTKGDKKGLHPFALLARAEFDPGARAAFFEFAQAMKGTRSLVWSRGLKARFAVAQVSDKAAAAAPDKAAATPDKAALAKPGPKPEEIWHERARWVRAAWPAARARGRAVLLGEVERAERAKAVEPAPAAAVEGGSMVPAAAPPSGAERTTIDAPGTAHARSAPCGGPSLGLTAGNGTRPTSGGGARRSRAEGAAPPLLRGPQGRPEARRAQGREAANRPRPAP